MGWPRIDQDGSDRTRRPGAPRDDVTWPRTGLFWVQYPRLIALQIHDRLMLRTVDPTPTVNKARADSLDEINTELAVRHACSPCVLGRLTWQPLRARYGHASGCQRVTRAANRKLTGTRQDARQQPKNDRARLGHDPIFRPQKHALTCVDIGAPVQSRLMVDVSVSVDP
jgi:hypothetical protein